jgi:hypothetical protein
MYCLLPVEELRLQHKVCLQLAIVKSLFELQLVVVDRLTAQYTRTLRVEQKMNNMSQCCHKQRLCWCETQQGSALRTTATRATKAYLLMHSNNNGNTNAVADSRCYD